MKNTILIMMDTENEISLRLAKPGDQEPPRDLEDLKRIVVLDMVTLCEALVATIRTAHELGVKSEAESMKETIEHLNNVFADPSLTFTYKGGFSEGKE